MAVGELLNKGEEARLVEAIRTAESKTTGEIRVHIAKRVSSHGIMADAAKSFVKLGMTETATRNGVLLYVAVKSRELACIGDKGIHEIVGNEGWNHIINELKAHFAKGDYFVGLHKAVQSIGETLARHFPGTGGINELPDEISKS